MGNVIASETEQQQINELRAEIESLKKSIKKEKPIPISTYVKSKSTEVEIYGSVRGDASYIIEGTDNDFSSVNRSNGTTSDKLRATLKASRIGFNFNTVVSDHKIGGKIETDFVGSSGVEALRLRHGYLTFNNWLIGQTTSNFLSNNAPEMVDYGTNVGGGTARVPQIRYSTQLSPFIQLLLSAEEGNSSGTEIKYKLPNLTAKVNYKHEKGSVSARVLVENYESEKSSKGKMAYGISLGTNYLITEPLKVSAEVSKVVGNSNYLDGANNAFVLDSNSGNIEQNEFTTYQIGATYKFSPQYRSTIGYGGVFADADTTFAKNSLSENKEVRQAWMNLIYSPVANIDLSAEYIDGYRKTFEGQSFKDNRVGLAFKYSF